VIAWEGKKPRKLNLALRRREGKKGLVIGRKARLGKVCKVKKERKRRRESLSLENRVNGKSLER